MRTVIPGNTAFFVVALEISTSLPDTFTLIRTVISIVTAFLSIRTAGGCGNTLAATKFVSGFTAFTAVVSTGFISIAAVTVRATGGSRYTGGSAGFEAAFFTAQAAAAIVFAFTN